MKTFIQMFAAARAVSTPIIAIKTADNMSTITTIRKSLVDADSTPLLAYDCVNGLDGLNDTGMDELATLLKDAGGVERGATPALALTLGILRYAREEDCDLIAFIQNAQLQLRDAAPEVIQGIVNLRDRYKRSGAMLILLIGAGDVLPVELQQDVLVLEQPLPTREELAAIVVSTMKAFDATPTAEVVKHAVDALNGLPAFPAEQSTAMCTDKATGILDINGMWGRKRDIVSGMAGLEFTQPVETLKDAAGIESIKKFGRLYMGGQFSPSVILRVDEMEKQFAGSSTDSSGSKGSLMGEFLTWIEDKKVVCSLLLGIAGSSKSHFIHCIAGEYGKPMINYSPSAMEHKHVGESSSNMRNAHRTIEAISDGRIWMIATANSLNGLPPELISRFQVGGIFFFENPDASERAAIMQLKIAKYGLDPKQEVPAMLNWTGREIENCARKSQLLGCSLIEAGKYVVPLMTSHRESMEALKESAHDRFLSASYDGAYQNVRKASAAVAGAPRRTR